MPDRAPRSRTDTIGVTAVLTRPSRRGPSRGLARWNAPGGWRWIAGHWMSRLELPIPGPTVGNRPRSRLTTQSVDEWRVDAEGVRILALSGPWPGLPAAANLAVGFAPTGLPTLDLVSTTGPATTLRALASTARSITFAGDPTEPGGPRLTIAIERVGRAGLRIVAELVGASGAAPLFAYSARRLADDQAA